MTTHPFEHLRVRELILWHIIISLLVGVGLGLAMPSLSLQDPLWPMLVYVLLLGLLSLWMLNRFRQRSVQINYLFGRWPRRALWLPAIGLMVAVLVFSIGSFGLLAYLISLVAPEFIDATLRELNEQNDATSAFPMVYQGVNWVATLVVAPVCEEFIFRGYILQRWAVKWSMPTALIASSILFGVLHPNPVGLSVFGLVMGLFYLQSGCLWLPIVCHFGNNLVVTLLSYIPNDSGESLNLQQLRDGLGPSIFFVMISLPWLVFYIRKTFPRRIAEIPYLLNSSDRLSK